MRVDEPGVLGGHDDVGVDDEVQPAAGHGAVDRGHHGLPDAVVARRPEDLLLEGPVVRDGAAGARHDPDVHAGAEVPVARPGDHDRADALVGAHVLPDRAQHRTHRGVEQLADPEGFLKLVSSDQSKAQRYAFFSEREAAKIAGVPDGTKPRNVERVAIIGAGTMGGGIAMSFANAGIPVTLIETGEEQLKRGMGVMQKNYEATAARGGIPADAPAKRMGLIKGVVGLENVRDADLVIEAVFETMAVKKEVFTALDKHAKPGAVLASNTSYLNIDEIAKVTSRPQDVLGMHFFSPANVMKLCEIVRADKTAPDALATAVSIARKIAKVPAVVGVCDGFVGNRMLAQRGKQSEKLLFEGALPQQVDAVVTKFGMPMGPFAMGDLAGLDIGWRSRKDRGIKSEIADALCEAGRFGQKTGKGYYKYEAGSRAALPDPEVEKLIDETLQRLGRKKRVVSDDEILERMMYPMINEGARILEEGIAARPSDIDVIWLYGYGWPIYRGGPMFYADQVGLKHIADRLSYYAKETNDPSLEPAPLLKRLAAEGKTFASLAEKAKAA